MKIVKQAELLEELKKEGYTFINPLTEVILEFAQYMLKYEYSITYLNESTKEDIENLKEKTKDILIEPVILPSLSNAIFISMYSDFEHNLNQMCHAYKTICGSKIKLTDFYGNGISRAANYLEKVIDIKIKDSSSWGRMNHWNKIRNCLVHNSGMLKESEIACAQSLNLNAKEKYGIKTVYFDYKSNLEFYNDTFLIAKACIKKR